MYEYMPLDWTTKQPTVDGWYWAVFNSYRAQPTVVHILEGTVFVNGLDHHYEIKDYAYWLGPLPVPEPPK